MRTRWENYYQKTSPKEVPWNKTQADYFTKLLDLGKLEKGKALDLGCGFGRRSIELAKRGFDVTGVDISETAISCAKKNASGANVTVCFITGDATDLSFLGKEKYDFVLDWANLHGLPKTKQTKYVRGIVKHMKRGGLLLLRCFSKYKISPNEIGFITKMGNIYLFSDDDIQDLYSHYFIILEKNRSKPVAHRYRWFDEYLMKRK